MENLYLVGNGVRTFIGKIEEDSNDLIDISEALEVFSGIVPLPDGKSVQRREDLFPIIAGSGLINIQIKYDLKIHITEDMNIYKMYEKANLYFKTGLTVETPKLTLL